jgi:phage terminase small subunit
MKRAHTGPSKIAVAARRKAFIEAFITNGCNATRAAITAGYSANGAQQAGTRLLSNVVVQQALTERAAQVAEITGLATERTLLEVARIAYADPRKLFTNDGALKDAREWDDDDAAIVMSVEIEQQRSASNNPGEPTETVGHVKKLKLWDKNSALEKAMKFAGLFREDNAQRGEPVTIIEVEYV